MRGAKPCLRIVENPGPRAEALGPPAAKGHVGGRVKGESVIRKLPSGKYRLYSRKKNAATGTRRNLGTFATLAAARARERAVQFFKRAG